MLLNKPEQVDEWTKLDIKLEDNQMFVKLSCGDFFCMVLTSNNDVITWGHNEYGQVGNGKKGTNPEMPYKLMFRPKMKAIEAPKKTKWYMCNHEDKPKKSKKKKDEIPDPFLDRQKIYNDEGNIIDIASNTASSFVLMDNGNLYGWGHICCMGINNVGQLSENIIVKDHCVLQPILIFGSIKQVVASQFFLLVLRTDGVLFGTGNNDFGQIGETSNPSFYKAPERFQMKFKRIGAWYNMAMGETNDGKFHIWGEYKPVRLAVVTIKEKIDIVKKVDKSVQVNLRPTMNRNDMSTIPAIAYYNDYHQEDIEDDQIEPSQSGDHEENEDEDEEEKNKLAEEEEEKKKARQMRKAREALEKGKVKYLKIKIDLSKPHEVSAGSFEEIVSRHFNRTYHTYIHDEQVRRSEETKEVMVYEGVGSGRVKGELIDFSNVCITNVEYELDMIEVLREVLREVNIEQKKSYEKIIKEQGDKIKEHDYRMSQKETEKIINQTVNHFHEKTTFGDKTKTTMFDKTTFSGVDGINISGNTLAGKVNS